MRSDLYDARTRNTQLLAKGLTNKQIGRVLGISSNTARNHVNSVIDKLDVSDRTEAATTAIQRGIIDAELS